MTCLDVFVDLFKVVSVDDGGEVLNKVLLKPGCLSPVGNRHDKGLGLEVHRNGEESGCPQAFKGVAVDVEDAVWSFEGKTQDENSLF